MEHVAIRLVDKDNGAQRRNLGRYLVDVPIAINTVLVTARVHTGPPRRLQPVGTRLCSRAEDSRDLEGTRPVR